MAHGRTNVYSFSMLRNAVRLAGPALALFLVASCSDMTQPAPEPPAQFIAVRRAWLPGERDSLIAHIIRDRLFVFPYVGDVSDLAPQFYADTDSVSTIVPNPAYTGAAPSIAGGGPMAAPGAAAGTLWLASYLHIGFKITTVNNNVSPPDTIFWHMVLWEDTTNIANHGFTIGYSRASTFSLSPINTTLFDNGFGKSGAASAEIHQGSGTFWADVGTGGTFQITAQNYPGAFSTVTTGPYLGGLSRPGTQQGRVNNSKMTRQAGAENPNSFTVSVDYRVTGINSTELLCVFPSPCTTNVPAPPAQAGPAWLVGAPWAYGRR